MSSISSLFGLRRIGATATLLVAGMSCAGPTQFDVKYAPGYMPPTAEFSVFGVYENGRLNAEAWREVGAVLSRGFGASFCETAWSYQLQSVNPPLCSAIDEYTKDNGISDELLSRLAPLAQGAWILSFTVNRSQGSVDPQEPKSRRPPASSARAASLSRVGAAPQGGLRAAGWARPTLADADARNEGEPLFEISALLFSVKERRSTVLVSMSHRGTDLDEALGKFALKLREAIPRVTCTGWVLETPIDVAQIQDLAKQQLPEVAIEPGNPDGE